MSSAAEPAAVLVEVAVTLPVAGTFTYTVPDGQVAPEPGTQVVVPFGARTVVGVVVALPAAAPEPGRRVLPVRELLLDAPRVDPAVIELCRFAARYYQWPLGEVLRAALPLGERVAARRSVRLTELGASLVARLGAGRADLAVAALTPAEQELLARLARTPALGLRGLARGPEGRRLVDRLERQGLIEVGDALGQVRRAPVESFAHAAQPGRLGHRRAPAQRALLELLGAAGPEGIAVRALDARQRVALRALVRLGAARLSERPARRDAGPPVTDPPGASPPELNRHQADALAAIGAALGEGYTPFLLHGITGSGKTEVYLHAIARARARGRGALVLVPEIALTPQLAARFRARFGDDVAVLHSGLPPAERLAAWRRLASGEVGIALGARSAVFAPVRALGIVVVDEEHDPSFKQEEGVRYHGRDLALVRAQAAGAVAVLGSATPSLESFQSARDGRFRLLRLPERAAPGAADRPLPVVSVLDLRQRRVGPDGLFAPDLREAIERTVAAGEQVILFLNRRGFSTLLLCQGCGYVHRCRDCEVAMTLHRVYGRLACHYCGRQEPVPARCPACPAGPLAQLGTGTERVEAVVRELFPAARVARLDRDTADGQGDHPGLERTLAAMHAGDLDILIGTQMVTKGHDFPGVTLVGVLQPDQGLNLPDFRAAERAFQLLEQVAGRAGRAARPGRVVVQTYCPEHPAIMSVITHDYDAFAKQELELRRQAGYPPFRRLAVVRVEAGSDAVARRAAERVAERLRAAAGSRAADPGGAGAGPAAPGLRVLGPAAAPIARLRARSRYQVWLSHPSPSGLLAALAPLSALRAPDGARVAVDVDPQSVL